jgi:hypothetical protein
MHQSTLIRASAREIGNLGLREDAARVDKGIARVLKLFAALDIFQLDPPQAARIVPFGRKDDRVEAGDVSNTDLVSQFATVFQDFGSRALVPLPMRRRVFWKRVANASKKECQLVLSKRANLS